MVYQLSNYEPLITSLIELDKPTIGRTMPAKFVWQKMNAGAASRFVNTTQGSEVHLHQTENPAACPPRTVFQVNTRMWLGSFFTSQHPVRLRSGMRLRQLCQFMLKPFHFPSTDAAGNMSVTNLTLFQSGVVVTLEPGNFVASDVEKVLQSELNGNVFDSLPDGSSVQIKVDDKNPAPKKLGWDSSAKQTYINRVAWDLSGNVCSFRNTPLSLIQVNPGYIEELDAQYSRNISAQTWVNIFAHEGIWGNAANKNDCNPFFSTCSDGEISAGALGVSAYLYDPYFVFPSSRTTIRSRFGF
jgi:hypothetical protein